MDTPYTNVAIRPPILDGTNYGTWKLKMSIYIQSIDSRACQRVLDGWSPPMRDKEGGGPKPRTQWKADEIYSSNYSAKAINAIFTSVDMNMFNIIGTCVCARNAWKKLQTHCEGSASVKKTRMRLLTSKFEKLIMEENEIIMQYNTRLKSLANEASVSGDPISNEILVSKVLCSVPKRFHTKFCATDESKDTSIMGLDELISSLRTYEMEMEVEDDYKGKSIAFQVSNDTYNDFSEMKQKVKESDIEDDSIALITKKFGDYLKVMKEKKKSEKGAQPLKFPSLSTSEKPQKPATTRGPRPKYESKNQFSSKNFDNIKSRECHGYGHYAYECANNLRKCKRNFQVNPLGVGSGVATPGCNTIQKSVCLVASNFDNSSDHDEQVAEAYTLKENTELKAAMSRLEVLISKKDLELGLLNSELEKSKTTLARFNSSSNKLDSLLNMGKDDKFGLEFKDSVFEIGESSKSPVFMKEGLKDHLTDYFEQNGGKVTYKGGAKGRIVGKGTLNVEGFPKLHNVLQDQQIIATNSVRNWPVHTQRLMILVYGTKSLVM
ncbi:uncharacterized protein [Henckelia pumila]|uniref:uncharacterized protein n=1 Tax=Henckelia pumila TaxID=405737 RepID=UPI003C6E4939